MLLLLWRLIPTEARERLRWRVSDLERPSPGTGVLLDVVPPRTALVDARTALVLVPARAMRAARVGMTPTPARAMSSGRTAAQEQPVRAMQDVRTARPDSPARSRPARTMLPTRGG